MWKMRGLQTSSCFGSLLTFHCWVPCEAPAGLHTLQVGRTLPDSHCWQNWASLAISGRAPLRHTTHSCCYNTITLQIQKQPRRFYTSPSWPEEKYNPADIEVSEAYNHTELIKCIMFQLVTHSHAAGYWKEVLYIYIFSRCLLTCVTVMFWAKTCI